MGQDVTLRLSSLSMGRAIPDGALVRVVPLGEVVPGEVVLFLTRNEELVCHRVLRVCERQGVTWLHTGGDTADQPDAPVTLDQILGVVREVEVEGELRPLHRMPWWRLAVRRLRARKH